MKKIFLISFSLCLMFLTGCKSTDTEKNVVVQKYVIQYAIQDYNTLITYAEKDPNLKKRDVEPFKCRRDQLQSLIDNNKSK